MLGAAVDVSFADGNGAALAAEFRRRLPLLPIVLAARHAAPELLELAQRHQLVPFLGAPSSSRTRRALKRLASERVPDWHVVNEKIERLATTRGLSPSERRIVEAIVDGRERRAILQVLGISDNTLKTQTRSILRKTSSASLLEVGRKLLLESVSGSNLPSVT